MPKSFPIHRDDTYTPMAEPTPKSEYMKFGGLDENLQLLDLSKELQQLGRRQKMVKF